MVIHFTHSPLAIAKTRAKSKNYSNIQQKSKNKIMVIIAEKIDI